MAICTKANGEIQQGCACASTASNVAAEYTAVSPNIPADAAGQIDCISVYCAVNLTSGNWSVGAFTDNGSNSLTCQSGHYAENITETVTAGSCVQYTAPSDFTVYSVDSGEYGGIHWTAGNLYRSNVTGDNMWHTQDDRIPCTNHTFTNDSASECWSHYETGPVVGAAAAPTGVLSGPLVGPLGGPI